MNLFAISLILSLICGINAYENGRGFRTSAVRNLRAEPTNLRAYVGGEGSSSSSLGGDFGLSFGSSGSGVSRGGAESSSGFSITTQSDGGERIRAEAEAAGKEFGNAIKSTITGGLGLFTKAIENTAKAATADVSFRSSAASSHSKGGGSSIATGSSNTGRNNIELNFNSRSDIRDRANSNINTKTKVQSDSGIGIRVQPIMCNSGMTQVDFNVRSDRNRDHEDSYADREAVLNAAGGAESELNNKFSYGISGHADGHQKVDVRKPGGIPFGLNIKTNIDDNPEATRTSSSGFSFEANSRSNLNSRKIDSDADNGDAGRGKISAGFTAGAGGGSDTRSSSSIGFRSSSHSNHNAGKVDSTEDGGHGKISLGFKTSGAKTSHERSSSLGFETSSRHHNSGNIESNAETRNNAAIKSSIGSEFSLGLGGRSKSRIESELEENDDAGKVSSGFKTSGGSSGGSRSEFGISITSGSRSKGSISSDGEDDNGNSERANFAAGFMNKGRNDDDEDVELRGRTNGKFGSSIETSGKTRSSSDFSIGIGSVSDLASRMGAMGGISLSTGSNFGEEENTDTSSRGGGSAGFSYLRSPSRRNYRRLRLSSPPSSQFPYRRHRSSIVIQ